MKYFWIIAAGFLFLFVLIILTFWLFEGDFSSVPKDQVLTWVNKDVCLVSTGNCGSGDYKFVYTLKCADYHQIVNSNELQCNKNSQIDEKSIDVIPLYECESFVYTPLDGDAPIWRKTANRLCLWLRDRNKLKNYRPIVYTIDDLGKFIPH